MAGSRAVAHGLQVPPAASGAIPSDQTPVAPERTNVALLLKPGAYLLTIETLDGLSVFGSLNVPA